jgi:Transcription factor WhiB
MDWRHRARCRDADPEIFFPVFPAHEVRVPASAGGRSSDASSLISPLVRRSSFGAAGVKELCERTQPEDVEKVLDRIGAARPVAQLVVPQVEAQVQSAKAICALCPVREECLQWAMDTAQDTGIWGGLTEEERRELRRQPRRRRRRIS